MSQWSDIAASDVIDTNVAKDGHACMDKESRLKVYFGPNDRLQVNEVSPRRSGNTNVVVKLDDILIPLTDAIEGDRTWLRDFRDDEVTISKDLYDVLAAYRKLRRSA